ncbi:MAG: hypothetical protein Q9191_007014, partial [Dirinaria sp. TL-2023a]
MASAARAATRFASHGPITSTLRSTTTRRACNNAFSRHTLQAPPPARRGYASGPPQTRKAPSVLGYSVAFGSILVVAGAAVWYVTTNEWEDGKVKEVKKGSSAAAAGESKTGGVFAPKKEDYQQVYNTIAKRLDEKEDYDDGSYGPVILRLAWHCSGTYDKETGTGGSNGATMRFAPEGDHGANAGLKAARDFLEPVKEQFPWITYSDLWTLAGVCAIQEMQGPIIPWRPGRQDRDVSMCTPDGRLPDGSKEHGHLRDIFGRMGFDDREIVALSGAHALGRCHTDRSGFEGPWSFSPTIMSNDYFRLLMEEKWNWHSSTKTLMMLPTDMALIKDGEFRKHVERYAKDDRVFFTEFKDVMVKLLELGVPFQSKAEDRISFTPLE